MTNALAKDKDIKMSEFIIHGDTIVGRANKVNEDSIDWYLDNDNDLALAMLADGVGDFPGGDVASRIAIEQIRSTICRSISEDSKLWEAERARMVWRIMDAVAAANQAIFSVRSKKTETARMATTLVTALAHGENLCIAHIGDSRCYRYQNGQLLQLTLDHSMAQELCSTGILGRDTAFRHVMTRTLGVERCVEPDASMYETRVNDIYLLCSDGLSSYITDKMISSILSKTTNLKTAVKKLLDAANDAGRQDDTSVILIQRTN